LVIFSSLHLSRHHGDDVANSLSTAPSLSILAAAASEMPAGAGL
jgi:hypothetical protein